MTDDKEAGFGLKDVASIAGTSALTVRRWLTAGDLTGQKVGDRGEWIISHDDLQAFLHRRGGRYADALRRWKADQATEVGDPVTPAAHTASQPHEQAQDHLGAVIEALRAELDAKNQQMAAKDQQIADLADAMKRRDEEIMRKDERHDQLLKMLPAPASSDQAEQKAPASWWARIFGRKP